MLKAESWSAAFILRRAGLPSSKAVVNACSASLAQPLSSPFSRSLSLQRVFSTTAPSSASPGASSPSPSSSSSSSSSSSAASSSSGDDKRKGGDKKTSEPRGPISWRTIFATAVLGAATWVGTQIYKEKTKKADVVTYQTVGKVSLGGPFEGLVDSEGKPAASSDYAGKYMLLYFGFTHCPDICPVEINKMNEALDKIEKKHPELYPEIKTLFISVDPRRDTVQRLKEYGKKFHPRMRWVTGSEDKIAAAAKKYRVFYSLPPNLKEGDDYLVDHSIFFYLMGREGEFVDFFGKNMTADEIAVKLAAIVRDDLAKRANKQQ